MNSQVPTHVHQSRSVPSSTFPSSSVSRSPTGTVVPGTDIDFHPYIHPLPHLRLPTPSPGSGVQYERVLSSNSRTIFLLLPLSAPRPLLPPETSTLNPSDTNPLQLVTELLQLPSWKGS